MDKKPRKKVVKKKRKQQSGKGFYKMFTEDEMEILRRKTQKTVAK